jgi:hypothetical protein
VRKKQWEKMKKNRENWIERGENEMIITIWVVRGATEGAVAS